jgi:MFS family permease
MRAELGNRPWWLLSLATGGLFGLIMTASLVARHGWTLEALLLGAVQGIAFGVIMGPLLARQRRRLLGDIARLPPERQREILRAVNGGPAPQDGADLEAARSVATRQHELAKGQRFGSTILFSGLTLISLALALTRDSLWFLGCVFFALMIGLMWWSEQRSRRRLLALVPEAAPQPPTGSA